MNNNLHKGSVVIFIEDIETCAFDSKNEAEDWIKRVFSNLEKVKEIWSTDYHGYLFVNYNNFKSSFVYFKIWSGLFDKDGNRIYFGDRLNKVDEFGNKIENFNWIIPFMYNDKDYWYLIAYPKGLSSHKQMKIDKDIKQLNNFIINIKVNQTYKFRKYD